MNIALIAALLVGFGPSRGAAAALNPEECLTAADDVMKSEGAKVEVSIVKLSGTETARLGVQIKGKTSVRQRAMLDNMSRVCFLSGIDTLYRVKDGRPFARCPIARSRSNPSIIRVSSCEKVEPDEKFEFKSIKEIMGKR